MCLCLMNVRYPTVLLRLHEGEFPRYAAKRLLALRSQGVPPHRGGFPIVLLPRNTGDNAHCFDDLWDYGIGEF